LSGSGKMNLFINTTDISTVTIQQETATQDASFNYVTGSPTALQADAQVDLQPTVASMSDNATGSAYRSTHTMYSQRYANVLSAYPSGGVVVVLGSTTFDVLGIEDWASHMETSLQERM